MLHYGVLLASAKGFDSEAPRFIEALLSAPGLDARVVRCQNKRVSMDGASQLLAKSLAEYTESWSAEVENKKHGSWAWVMAEHLVASRTNNFDVAGLSAVVASEAPLATWFRGFCEASRAEFAVLDQWSVVQALSKVPIRSELHRGLPGLAWMTWLGPQGRAGFPRLAEAGWAKCEQVGDGCLFTMSDREPDAQQRLQLKQGVPEEYIHPRRTGVTFDLSTKNRVTPAWLTSEQPPGAAKKPLDR